jgi:hypothetical protein
MTLQLSVVRDDVASQAADVLLLKHAQGFYGADEAVAVRLTHGGACKEDDLRPAIGEYRLIETIGAIAPDRVLFLGTPHLREFRYPEMRVFARKSIEALSRVAPQTERLTTTVHGANTGLDIEEALRSLVFGFQQGLTTHPLTALREVVFVERNQRRFEVIQRALGELDLVLPSRPASGQIVHISTLAAEPARKRTVFVAMPFSEEFEDIYQFGIYAAVRNCGYVCEKVDESVFAGNIVDRITEAIRNATFVVADLTQERPNVYLEVGFAWGLKKPVLLVARDGQKLHFDLSHHKCIFYKTIGKLNETLEKTIRDMFGAGDQPESGRG